MKLTKRTVYDCTVMILTLLIAFGVNFLVQQLFRNQTLIPMIFILGVFLVSWWTQGYFWGITASLISVLAVNYAFTYPYWAFDLISPECIFSAVVMTYSAIIREIWGGMDEGSIKKLQVNMANIRRKLGDKPGEQNYIVNELGVGYRIQDP